MKGPTPRQLEILAWIVAYRAEHEISPTIREIANGFGFDHGSAVKAHLDALKDKGFISSQPRKARSIRVLAELRYDTPIDQFTPPVCNLACGLPYAGTHETGDKERRCRCVGIWVRQTET